MHVQNKKYVNFVFISRLAGKYATQKLKKIRKASLWTFLHHMVICRRQDKKKKLMIFA